MNLLPLTSEYFIKANLPQRIRLIPFVSTLKTGRNVSEWKNVDAHSTDLIYVSAIKYLVDGTPFEGATLNRKPYPGTNPGGMAERTCRVIPSNKF